MSSGRRSSGQVTSSLVVMLGCACLALAARVSHRQFDDHPATMYGSDLDEMTYLDNYACSKGNIRGLCECYEDNYKYTVDCKDLGVMDVPGRFPDNTTLISLNNNRIHRLRSGSFASLHMLHTLYLENNSLSKIESGAFRNLFSLVKLTLRKNKIKSLDARIFDNLINVQNIDLSHNNIHSISSDVFVLLGNLTEVLLSDNHLKCDCEILSLRKWAQQRKMPLLTDATCRNFEDLELVEVPEERFGDCPDGEADQACLVCDAESSVESCIASGERQTCSSQENGCQTVVSVTEGLGTVTSFCQSGRPCVEHLQRNADSCQDGAVNQTCVFCCVGDYCNADQEYYGYDYQTLVRLMFKLRRQFDPHYSDHLSGEHIQLSEEIRSKINPVLEAVPGKHLLEVIAFRQGSVLCDLRVTSTVSLNTSVESLQDAMHAALRLALDSGDLDLDIDPESIVAASPGTCPPVFSAKAKGDFEWPATRGGATVSLPCPFPGVTDGQATRHCLSQQGELAAWEAEQLSDCTEPTASTRNLQELANRPVNNDTAAEIAQNLQDETFQWLEPSSLDVEFTTQVLVRLLQGNNDTKLTMAASQNILSVYDNILQLDKAVLVESQINYKSPRRFLQSLDGLSTTTSSSEGNMLLVRPRIALGRVAVEEVTRNGSQFLVLRLNDRDMLLNETEVKHIGQAEPLPPQAVEISMVLPASAVSAVEPKVSSVQFVVFHESKIFSALEEVQSNKTAERTSRLEKRSVYEQTNAVNSRVIAATFGGQHIKDLKEPVLITLRSMKKGANPSCVFWEFGGPSSRAGNWSTKGCKLKEAVSDEYTVCECDHLTNFALIMDIYGTGSELDEANKKALSIISYTGCAISLLALCFTLITYTIFRKLRRDNPSKILMNLCAALIVVLVFFIVCTQPSVTSSDAACKATAMVLHYALLATWCWMAVEAFYMYLALIKVFKTYISKFMIKCSLVGWGCPLVLVILTVAISPDNYGAQGEICWLARDAFYGACLTPILVILVLNFLAFGLVVRQLRRMSTSKALESTKTFNTASQLRGAASVVVLLGLTWVFAIFAIGGAGIVFNYLFCIFNTFQGLFICIFYCILKKDARDIWRKTWRGVTTTADDRSTSYTGKGHSYGTASDTTDHRFDTHTGGKHRHTKTETETIGSSESNGKAGEASISQDAAL